VVADYIVLKSVINLVEESDKIRGYHGGDHEEYNILDCNAV
jgi:hypothetical protein